jgi:hypothetical protein
LLDKIESELGPKVSMSKLEQDCMAGRGPKPCRRFGKRYLYTPSEALRYGHSLIENVPAEGTMQAGPGRPPRKAK